MKYASRREVIILSVLMVGLAFSALFALGVSAQESTITFPVAELGNCKDKESCHAYCDNLDNVDKCVAFAEAHGLMSTDEAKKAKGFARLGGKGPGGCTSKEKCEAFCEDPKNMRQCIAFAKSSGMMEEGELKEAEKVVEYLESGGETPGNCRGEKQCRAYCEAETHMSECADFAIKMGFMSEKEAEMFRKTGGKGPGGCAGRACQAYCEDDSHREECVTFAMEHDLMSEEDKERMEEGREKAKEALEKAPPEVLTCIEAVLGADKVEQYKRGEGIMSPRLGEVLPQCFRDVMGKEERRGPFGRGVPTEATDCMQQVFGEGLEERMKDGDIDPGAHDDEIRECMQAQMGEGFLSDDGRWEKPQSSELPTRGEYRDARPGELEGRFGPRPGEGHDALEAEMRARYGEDFDVRRRDMEERMRAEIESQMQSGNFDESRLPPDYRPEGMFPPPESLRRPPEGYSVPTNGMPMPPEGYMMPAGDMPAGYMPPSPPPDTDARPTSKRGQFMANVLGIFQSLLGM